MIQRWGRELLLLLLLLLSSSLWRGCKKAFPAFHFPLRLVYRERCTGDHRTMNVGRHRFLLSRNFHYIHEEQNGNMTQHVRQKGVIGKKNGETYLASYCRHPPLTATMLNSSRKDLHSSNISAVLLHKRKRCQGDPYVTEPSTTSQRFDCTYQHRHSPVLLSWRSFADGQLQKIEPRFL